MTQRGTVTKINGKRITVSTVPLEACCSKEGEGQCCGGGKSVEFRAYNAAGLPLVVNDYVEVNTGNKKTLTSAVRLLALPAALAVAGYLAPSLFQVKTPEYTPAMLAFFGFLIGLALNALLFGASDQSLPHVSRIITISDVAPLNPLKRD